MKSTSPAGVPSTGPDADGRNKPGTGASAEEAMESAKDTSEPIGEGFGTASGH